MKGTFEVRILEQQWLEGCDPAADLCSHGKISLVIDGVRIFDEQEELGVSESALAMLRTLAPGHDTNAGEQYARDRMIPHGCGLILMLSCPIGADWRVHHTAEKTVRISDAVWYPSTNEDDAVRFPGLVAELPLTEYRDQVLAFAAEVERFFDGVEKCPEDDFDKEQHKEFWEEFHELVAEHSP